MKLHVLQNKETTTCVDPANADKLAAIAREVGAEFLEGNLRYQSVGWQLDEVDLGEYLDRYRDQRLMVVFVPLGNAETVPVICGVCGFVMNELQECPRCKLVVEETAKGGRERA